MGGSLKASPELQADRCRAGPVPGQSEEDVFLVCLLFAVLGMGPRDLLVHARQVHDL